MSLFGALDTAISGLTAQSASFGNISDNIANSQTTGFKRVDTNFLDYLTTSTATNNEPGSVVATPQYLNTVQGTITQTSNPLALAISGQGFFTVSQADTTGSGGPTFSPQPLYTRDGNFQLNATGYLVNDSGGYLNGWTMQSNGQVDTTTLQPIQVSQQVYAPVATSTMTLAANLPPAGSREQRRRAGADHQQCQRLRRAGPVAPAHAGLHLGRREQQQLDGRGHRRSGQHDRHRHARPSAPTARSPR